MTFKSFLHKSGIEMRVCWKGPISTLHAARGNSGRRRFFECVVRAVEPSGSPTLVPCFIFLESVPGVSGVKNEWLLLSLIYRIPFSWMVVLEVSSLHLNVKLFKVCSGHQHRQRPISSRCFSNPPMMLVWVDFSL